MDGLSGSIMAGKHLMKYIVKQIMTPNNASNGAARSQLVKFVLFSM